MTTTEPEAHEAAAEKVKSLASGAALAAALGLAARFGIADLLKHGSRTAAHLARVLSLDEDALYRVLRILAAHGIFLEVSSRTFALTPLGASLKSDAPGSARAFAAMVVDEWSWRSLGELEYSVRTGRTALPLLFRMDSANEYFERRPEAAALRNDVEAEESRAAATALVATGLLASAVHVVDVGGGDGGLLSALLEAHPGLVGTLVERPAVARGASDRLAEHLRNGRARIVAGDFLTAMPWGGDVYLIVNVLSSLDDAEAAALLSNVSSARAAGGRVLVVEGLLRSGAYPAVTAESRDLLSLVATGGRERTIPELCRLFTAAGLVLESSRRLTRDMSLVEAR